jgi:hypothetical protein
VYGKTIRDALKMPAKAGSFFAARGAAGGRTPRACRAGASAKGARFAM